MLPQNEGSKAYAYSRFFQKDDNDFTKVHGSDNCLLSAQVNLVAICMHKNLENNSESRFLTTSSIVNTQRVGSLAFEIISKDKSKFAGICIWNIRTILRAHHLDYFLYHA